MEKYLLSMRDWYKEWIAGELSEYFMKAIFKSFC